MILFIVLLMINLWILRHMREPQELLEVKEKYTTLRKHLVETDNQKYKMLTRCIPITGIHSMRSTIGYNTNKGQEIGICIDGTSNEMFHVLIHELAHSSVTEYSHSEEFWANYVELRDICINLGIYEKIPHRKPFCGQNIQDK
jgi:predicted metal-dependent hydrolase